MDDRIVNSVQRRFEPAILANRLVFADRWGGECLAYNLCIMPGSAAPMFSALQENILDLEPNLLRVPEAALHSNVTWLLPVNQEFDHPKDELWQQKGMQWITAIAALAIKTQRFQLRFRRIIMTDSAIIAIAEESNPVSTLRREIKSALHLPGCHGPEELVHITLFRYSAPLHSPVALFHQLKVADVDIGVSVTELSILREKVFPSLNYDIVHRIALASSPTGISGNN